MKNSLFIYSTNLFQRLLTNGLLPILPLYAIDLGMSKSFTGVYLASSYLFLFISSIISGYLVDKMKHPRILLLISSLLFGVLLFVHSLVTTASQLFIATSLLWFVFGLQMVVLTRQQGTRTNVDNRGSKFAKFSISSVLGAVIGGLIIGVLLKAFSIETMFVYLSLVAILPLISSILMKVTKNDKKELGGFINFNNMLMNNKRLMLFYLSGMAISIVNYMLILIVSLRMKEVGYDYSEISFSVVVGVLLSVPATYIFGKLSDKQGRKLYLFISYFCGIIALFLLFNAVLAYVFAIVVFFKSVMTYSRAAVSFAFINDITTTKNLGKSISYFGSTIWIGGIIGYLITGVSIEQLGFENTLFIGLIITSVSIVLLFMAYRNTFKRI